MHRARVIPCLLLSKGGLVKTTRFATPRYLGDPINTVRILNEKEVDELIILDIHATTSGLSPNLDLIEDIVSEAFMPLAYGGGVSTLEQMRQLYRAGIEKISLSAAALACRDLVRSAVREFGSQAVVVTLDLKTSFFRNYAVVTHNARQKHSSAPIQIAQDFEALGVGELLLNFVDLDGTMSGYNHAYVREITSRLEIPVIALGGAGNLEDLRDVVEIGGAAAAAAGSLFVYHGKHRAVLINYPSQRELHTLFRDIDDE
ncbi:MAG: AglZ/HisF2 family acetamidino modification protein [Nitrospirae bacterium]|nr:AglZ/HisF2 family acetamidino modification protein [Nitrospirota bacterium]